MAWRSHLWRSHLAFGALYALYEGLRWLELGRSWKSDPMSGPCGPAPRCCDQGRTISSSRLREMLKAGQMEEAATILGLAERNGDIGGPGQRRFNFRL